MTSSTRRILRLESKRWVEDHEVSQCPLCKSSFEGHFLDITISGRTHCRFCGGVFCTNCCKEELYMPEDEVVRPPPSAKFKSIIFDPTQKQKACRTCVKVLLPQQESIKAARGRSGGSSSGGNALTRGFTVRRMPTGPYFSIVIIRARDLRGNKSSVTAPVCLATVGVTSSITQPTQHGANPVWDQAFDFPVDTEHGNHLKVTVYEEEMGHNKMLVGEGSTKVLETGVAGAWVPITDDRKAVTGEVLIRCTFKGARTPKPVSTPAGQRSIIPALHSYDGEGEADPLPAAPVLHWLQEKAWLVYVVLLLISVLYRFANSRTFSGDPIALRPGAPTNNNVSKRSETHYITLQKDGNLVLREGKPGDPLTSSPVWESGKPFEKKDCPKCVFLLDDTGENLQVKSGRKVLKSFHLPEEKLLSLAIKTP